MRELDFSSSLAQPIQALIEQKRAIGYRYESSGWTLYKLDQFCIDQEYSHPFITQELAQAWIARRPTEALATQRNRAIVIRQLGLYQARLDIESYVLPPRSLPPKEHYEPYIFSDQELSDLFKQIDACQYCSWMPLRHLIMPLLFRLLYRCGLRLSEALHLRVCDVDLEQGVLRIIDGKFNNDRLVPLSQTTWNRCRDYHQSVHHTSDEQNWFFPAPGGRPLTKGNVYKNYRRFLWQARISHGGWGKGPRLHDLRHTYCVHCLRHWVHEKADLTAFLPLLKTYMGHYSFQDTARYLRLTAELYPDIIEKSQSVFEQLIPASPNEG